ncbi:hypothetical protein LCGC14_1101830 [marine sediment metagenome]|uniref:Uncharacterized protein n=1 Tax=marine sediment metagenome TaxID=412755 RepID=A0A0F9M983_9ZZZZ
MAKSTEEKVVRISRAAVANRLVAELNGLTTLEALAEKADDMFVKGGGQSKPTAAKHHVRRALETAEAMGVIELTRPTDLMVKKVKK